MKMSLFDFTSLDRQSDWVGFGLKDKNQQRTLLSDDIDDDDKDNMMTPTCGPGPHHHTPTAIFGEGVLQIVNCELRFVIADCVAILELELRFAIRCEMQT